jgi:hypothetical protein
MEDNGATSLTGRRIGLALMRRQGGSMQVRRGTARTEPEPAKERRFRLYWDPKRRVLLRTR